MKCRYCAKEYKGRSGSKTCSTKCRVALKRYNDKLSVTAVTVKVGQARSGTEVDRPSIFANMGQPVNLPSNLDLDPAKVQAAAIDTLTKLAYSKKPGPQSPAALGMCRHQSEKYTLNYGSYKTDLEQNELNRVSLPGDRDYVRFRSIKA